MVLAMVGPASSADAARNEPRKGLAPVPFFNWTGFYVGGHLGYSRGNASGSLADPIPASSSNSFGSLFAGLQLGYNHLLKSGFLLGVESDFSFPNFLGADDIVRSRITAHGNLAEKIDYVARLRGRIGYAFDNFLIYGTGGFAWSQARFIETSNLTGDEDKALRVRSGWVLGAGEPKSRLLRTGVRGLNTSTITSEKPPSPCHLARARNPALIPIHCDWD